MPDSAFKRFTSQGAEAPLQVGVGWEGGRFRPVGTKDLRRLQLMIVIETVFSLAFVVLDSRYFVQNSSQFYNEVSAWVCLNICEA